VTQPTCSAAFMRALLDFAVSRGASRAALLANAELGEADFADLDARLPFARYEALMRAAKTLTGDAALALHFGEHVQIAEVSIVGLIGRAAETMQDAFTQLSRYVRLIVDVPLNGERRFEFQRRESGLWFVDCRADPNDFPELTESAFTHIVTPPRLAGVPEWVREVHVTHAAPSHRAEYDRIFRAPVRFEQPWNALRVEEAIVTHRIALLPRYVFGVLTERAVALMAALEQEGTARSQVERLLIPVLHTGEGNIESVASKLGVTRQTLWRNLKAEGVTFEQVLDELRHKMALEYLAAGKVSVHETAYLVGFSDPAAFSRAFKRWTGKSPSEMRGA
jgi:AraC-like DNA-binding protein